MFEGILGYQFFIILTLFGCRAVFPALLLPLALAWSALSLINIFWPHLIVMQLVVVWATYVLMAGDSGIEKETIGGSRESTRSVIGRSPEHGQPHHSLRPDKDSVIGTGRQSVASLFAAENESSRKAPAKGEISPPRNSALPTENAVLVQGGILYTLDSMANQLKEKARALNEGAKREAAEDLAAMPEHIIARTAEKHTSRTEEIVRRFYPEHLFDRERYAADSAARVRAELSKETAPPAPPLQSYLSVPNKKDALTNAPRIPSIESIVRDRGITQLLHFTRTENLSTILSEGLLPISEIERRSLPTRCNDNLRLDGRPNAISLSISFPNYRMFWKYRMENPSADWVVLMLDPGILTTHVCAYCHLNAADHRMRHQPQRDLSGVKAFEAMFADSDSLRRQPSLRDCDPTDPQAELLVFASIAPASIRHLVFQSHLVRDCYADITVGQKTLVDPTYFMQREAAIKHWSTHGAASSFPA